MRRDKHYLAELVNTSSSLRIIFTIQSAQEFILSVVRYAHGIYFNCNLLFKCLKKYLNVLRKFRFTMNHTHFPFHVFNRFAGFNFISFDVCQLKSLNICDCVDYFNFKLLQLKIILLLCVSIVVQFIYFESFLDSFYLINEFYGFMRDESMK